MEVPSKQETKIESQSETGGNRDLLEKLRKALLLKGQPMNGFNPNDLLPLFNVNKPLKKPSSKESPRPLVGLTFENCSSEAAKNATIVITELVVKPDPIVTPGTLTFAFSFNLKKEVEVFTVALKIYKKIGPNFIEIPCIDHLGSCTYNICDLLEEVQTCPQKLVDHGIHCKCPYKQGAYSMPGISATIGAPVLFNGEYNATATLMTSGGAFAGCYKATFKVGE